MLKHRIKKLEDKKIPRCKEVKLLYVDDGMVTAVNGVKVKPYVAPKNTLEIR